MKNLSMKTLITTIAIVGLFGIVRAEETTTEVSSTTGVSVTVSSANPKHISDNVMNRAFILFFIVFSLTINLSHYTTIIFMYTKNTKSLRS